MKKTPFNKLDLDLYEETLDNGLRIYVVPFKDSNNIYATFSTNFGSDKTEFIPYGKKDMIKVPDGIAHFLEHKMFEQKDGIDPFSYYSERGSDSNANTDNTKTTYLFSGISFYEENLNFLLDYVQDPYFTDENVKKEKGIIEQEMKMYNDDPYSVIYENLIYNMFVKYPTKQPIIGNHDSIYSTTKEDLFNCYNTFYQPSNMYVVVTGNVDPEETIRIIKENQSKKEFPKQQEIIVKKYDEPDNVAVKECVKKMSVNIPKVAVGWKVNIKNSKLPLNKICAYLDFLLTIKYSSTSLINEQLKDEGIINEELSFNTILADNHMGLFVFGESKNTKELIKRIKDNFKDLTIDESELERKKKAVISSIISASDNIFSMNEKIMGGLNLYNKVNTNQYDTIKNLNIEEMNQLIKELDFTNINTYVIESK